MSVHTVTIRICLTGVPLGDSSVLLPSSHNKNLRKKKPKTLNTTGSFLPFYFISFLLHKIEKRGGKKGLNLNQVLDLHFSFTPYNALGGKVKDHQPKEVECTLSVSHLAPAWQTSRWVLLTPPACQLLFSSGCICFSGAAEAAGVNVAVKKVRQLQACKVQEGACRISTSLEMGRQNGSVCFCLQKKRPLVLTCQGG